MRDISFNKHLILNYALVFIYILGTNTFGNRIKAFIIRKAYVIENFKVKILIGINIIGPKSINIFIIKKKVYIKSCKTSLLINITVRGQNIQRAVYI